MDEKSDWIYGAIVTAGACHFPRDPFWMGQVELTEHKPGDGRVYDKLKASMAVDALVGPREFGLEAGLARG